MNEQTTPRTVEEAAQEEAKRLYRQTGMHHGTPSDRERAAFVAGATWQAAREALGWRDEVAARAWDEGAQSQAAAYGMDKDTGPNPYRLERQEGGR